MRNLFRFQKTSREIETQTNISYEDLMLLCISCKKTQRAILLPNSKNEEMPSYITCLQCCVCAEESLLMSFDSYIFELRDVENMKREIAYTKQGFQSLLRHQQGVIMGSNEISSYVKEGVSFSYFFLFCKNIISEC